MLGRLIDLALVRSRTATARDIELLALRHEVRGRRRTATPNRRGPGDRPVPTARSRPLTRSDRGRLPVRPETLLRWHREPVRREWAAFGRRQRTGRPALPAEPRDLVRRLAAENRTWGYHRIRGELLKHVPYYNHQRPHRTLALETPLPVVRATTGAIRASPVLGGLHHVYERAA